MRFVATAILIAGAAALRAFVPAPSQAPEQPPKYSFAEPGISPDGREIAFTSGGDIWSVPAAGGDARLLVADGSYDRRPLYSPDGRHLAFVSSRTGGGDVYVLTFATGDVRRMTWDDGLDQVEGWSRDSRWLYFSATGRDIASMNDIFRVPLDGGTPMPVSADRYVNEFGAAASPDGTRLAFVARGNGSAQWWRKSGSHLDQSELWLLEGSKYTQLTKRDARQLWPMWNADGRALFYVSEKDGVENVWTRSVPAATPATGAERQVTTLRDGRVLWPSITSDGKVIAFERNFGIWALDTASGQAREVSIVRRGAATAPAPERMRQTTQFEGLALSPDGKKVAFVARGALFAASAKDGGDAARVTSTSEIETQPAWAPDSRRLVFARTRGAGQQIVLYDFSTNAETALTAGTATDLSPVFSPDGKRVAYLSDRKTLHVLDPATRDDRVLATAIFADTINSPRPVWSPDGRWIALFTIGTKAFTNVSLISLTDGAPPRPVSFLSNVYANTIAWSKDGTFLLFDTNQRTEGGRLARVDLTLRTPKFREDLFKDLFTPTAPESPNPGTPPGTPSGTISGTPSGTFLAPVFADIRQRLSLIPVGVDVDEVTISPDGKTAVLLATSAGQTNLYSWSLDELATERPVARQLTTTASGKANPHFSPDSKEIYYLDGGRINIVSVERREARPLNVTAEFTNDFSREKLTVFQQAWTLLRDNFFDPGFSGVNWESSRERYGERAAASGTPDELRRVISLMVGDLNASHLGINPPPGAPAATGHLGLQFDRAGYESTGRLRITHVVPLGPAALTGQIKAGDVLIAVNGQPVGARMNLDEVLANTIDRRVVLTVATPVTAAANAASTVGSSREVAVRPTNQATEKSLMYRDWVEQNREYVLKKSGGRLGYVHMINMSAAALDQLHIDLDAENHMRDGVVIDIRNNNGGFVHAYAIDVFSRQPYLRMSTRGLGEAPARTVLGQRSLESVTVLVTNQHSLSDAEDFTEAYRTLKLGPVIGEPTAGWIIYTWDARLVDGSILRLPRMRIRAADGSDMERHSRTVDYPVSRPVGETLIGQDAQLDEAIRQLLKKLGRAE
jgi:Tol biopolymer transport system component/C-terminal processing protease CtpA/Prc